MRVFILVLFAAFFFLSACQSTPDRVDPIDQSPPTTQPPVVVEPGEPPVRITELGLKVGRCAKPMKGLKWRAFSWHGAAPACDANAQAGSACAVEYSSCSVNGHPTMKLECVNPEPMKCHGWVYEKDILTGQHKPFAGVNVDLWSMPLCMIGACDPLVGPLKTNQFGYYELSGSAIPDSTNVRAYIDGFYGVCGNDNKPSCIGGKCSTGDTIQYSKGAELRPIPLMKITETSCN